MVFHFHDERSWHVIREPDTVFRNEKRVALGGHGVRVHYENRGFAMPLANRARRCLIRGKMDVMAFPFPQTFEANGIQEARGRAMKKLRRGDFRHVAQRNVNGVSLAGANLSTIVTKCEPFLLIGRHDLFQIPTFNRLTMPPARRKQRFDIGPSR